MYVAAYFWHVIPVQDRKKLKEKTFQSTYTNENYT